MDDLTLERRAELRRIFVRGLMVSPESTLALIETANELLDALEAVERERDDLRERLDSVLAQVQAEILTEIEACIVDDEQYGRALSLDRLSALCARLKRDRGR